MGEKTIEWPVDDRWAETVPGQLGFTSSLCSSCGGWMTRVGEMRLLCLNGCGLRAPTQEDKERDDGE